MGWGADYTGAGDITLLVFFDGVSESALPPVTTLPAKCETEPFLSSF